MLNFFKNLFGSSSAENHANGNSHGYAQPLATATGHAQPTFVEEIRSAPAPSQLQPPPVPVSRPEPDGHLVQIPFYAIIAVLPLELKTRIRQTQVSDIFVPIAIDRVLAQL